MNVSFNSLTSNSFVNSVTEKGTNVLSQLNRKIYIVATILFAALVTAALIYQKLRGDNEKTIRKGADLPEEGTVAINSTPTVSDRSCESLEAKKETNGFPIPYETLKTRGLYKPAEEDSIIAIVDQALRSSQGERVPPEYTKLQHMIGAGKLLEQLYQEAKILAHEYSVQDLESCGYVSTDTEYKKQYPIILFTNLSILISGLCKNRQFVFIT